MLIIRQDQRTLVDENSTIDYYKVYKKNNERIWKYLRKSLVNSKGLTKPVSK